MRNATCIKHHQTSLIFNYAARAYKVLLITLRRKHVFCFKMLKDYIGKQMMLAPKCRKQAGKQLRSGNQFKQTNLKK